jgi:hypothetical protein
MTPPDYSDKDSTATVAASSTEADAARRNGEPSPVDAAASPEANGTPAPGTAAESPGDNAPPEDASSLERAEALADHFGSQVGIIASVIGRTFIRWAALTREAVEDCWAEAQDIRRGKKDEPPIS